MTNESHDITTRSHDVINKYMMPSMVLGITNIPHDVTSGSHDVTNPSHDVITMLTDYWMHSIPVQPHDRLIQVRFLSGRV